MHAIEFVWKLSELLLKCVHAFARTPLFISFVRWWDTVLPLVLWSRLSQRFLSRLHLSQYFHLVVFLVSFSTALRTNKNNDFTRHSLKRWPMIFPAILTTAGLSSHLVARMLRVCACCDSNAMPTKISSLWASCVLCVRLKELVPTFGPLYTRLPLLAAFNHYNDKYRSQYSLFVATLARIHTSLQLCASYSSSTVSHRIYVAPSFNEIRHACFTCITCM